MGISIDHNAVTRASAQMESAAAQIVPVKPETRLATIATALPGSSSAGAASSCGTRWRTDLDAWHTNATEYARTMEACSEAYATTDNTAADNFRRAVPRGAAY
ncbi:hypothetical protein GCM10027596_09310 [Nocardioides korecus]